MPGAAAKPQLDLYTGVEALLKPYEKKMSARRGLVSKKRDYHLYTGRPMEYLGHKHSDVCFASVVEQKKYVGFYFMPIYMNDPLKNQLPASLLKLLKGKACFHITELTPQLKADIAEALRAGFSFYKKMNWV